MTNPPAVLDWIKPSSGTHWYVVTVVDGLNISIAPEFQEDTLDPVTAQKMPAAYRMSGISGSNMLTGTGATSSIRGVTGHVGLTNGGNVQAGIGTRGGMSMTGGGWMGLGACLGTYTDISDGALGVWYGLGIESPVFSGSASVSKEIAGVGIGSLLGRAVNGTVESTCMVYGIKIKTIDPEGGTVPPENTYGIYQEGDEQNYLGGSLEVNGATALNSTLVVAAATYLDTLNVTGAVDFYDTLNVYGASTFNSSITVQGDVNFPGTTKVRAYLDEGQTISANTDTLVEFEGESFDTLNEFDDEDDHVFTAKNAGFYQVNVNVLFLITYEGVSLRARILKNDTPYSISVADGFDVTYPSNGPMSISFSEIVELDVDETISVDVRSSVLTGLSQYSTDTNLSIHRIP